MGWELTRQLETLERESSGLILERMSKGIFQTVILTLSPLQEMTRHQYTVGPDGPWKEVVLDFKGLVGGKNGFYYRQVIDMFSL